MLARNSVSDRTTRYARDVVEGKITAGQWQRLACQRHLDDLKHGPSRGLKWDVDLAEKNMRFFPAVLTITEGEKEGEPFTLLPWHVFVVGSLFGWRDANGNRRFRTAWLETGKGQAKSPLMAGIGHLLLSFSGLQRAEVYCIGEDKGTARVVFRDAVAMSKAPIPNRDGETLETSGRLTIRGTGDNAYKIEHKDSGSIMQPMANTDAVSGPKPIAVLADEIHEMKKRSAIQIWEAAIAKKAGDPIMILGTNTPSSDQPIGTQESERFQGILRGDYEDDSAFAFIARVDEDDDPFEDESCWPKSLPALGITFPIDSVRKMVASARTSSSIRLAVERLYFGIPVGSSGFWMDEGSWNACRGTVDEDEMTGRRMHLSLDLSQRHDLSALTAAWEGKTICTKTWYWTREHEIEQRSVRDRIPYRELEAEGAITISKARTIDYTFIAEQVRRLDSKFDAEQLVVDSAYIEDFLKACRDIGYQVWLYEGPDGDVGQGLKIVRHAQGKRVVFQEKMLCMPKSIERTEDRILGGTVIIDDNRLTSICASNAVLDVDAQMNRAFQKERSRGRIDGMVTNAMAIGAASVEMEARNQVATPWDLDPKFSLADA